MLEQVNMIKTEIPIPTPLNSDVVMARHDTCQGAVPKRDFAR
jgi:hypothetical protein